MLTDDLLDLEHLGRVLGVVAAQAAGPAEHATALRDHAPVVDLQERELACSGASGEPRGTWV